MANKERDLPGKLIDLKPTSPSNCALEKQSKQNVLDKSEIKREAPLGEDLLVTHACNGSGKLWGATFQPLLELDSYALYRGIGPKDSIEGFTALAVGLTNASLDCLAHAVRCHERPDVRDLNLRHGIKGAVVAADL